MTTRKHKASDTAAKEIQRLQAQESDNSCDEEKEFDIAVAHHLSRESDQSDSSDSEFETEQNQQHLISATVDTSQYVQDSTIVAVGTSPPSDRCLKAQNRMTWKTITEVQDRERALAANVFTERPGLTSHTYRYIVKDSPISAFRLFVDKPMLRSIQKHTTSHVRLEEENLTIHLDELESFVGLQIARGVLLGKNTSLRQLWNAEWGHLILSDIISRNRYQTIMKHLRFDEASCRSQRRQYDKFYFISDT